jgi:multiple sugar transport system permease protein
MKEEKGFSYFMTLPTIIIMGIITIFPVIYTAINSFTDYYYLSNKPKNYIGITNYINIIKDTYFIQSVFNTFKFMILAVIIEVILGILFAELLNGLKKGAAFLRIVILLPNLLPPVTVALIWQMMFSNNNGIINQMLGAFKLAPVNWLGSVSTAFYSILIIDIWQWTPFVFLLIYATMQGIPESQYEAAKIDGANAFNQFIYVTIPNIFNGIMLVILLRTIDSFRLFDKVNILTKGGPANSTATITQYIYEHGIRNLKVGYGSAASIIMTFLVMIVAVIYVRKAFERKDV